MSQKKAQVISSINGAVNLHGSQGLLSKMNASCSLDEVINVIKDFMCLRGKEEDEDRHST